MATGLYYTSLTQKYPAQALTGCTVVRVGHGGHHRPPPLATILRPSGLFAGSYIDLLVQLQRVPCPSLMWDGGCPVLSDENYSLIQSTPLSEADTLQDPRRMPETANSTEPYIHYAFSYMHIPVIV